MLIATDALFSNLTLL